MLILPEYITRILNVFAAGGFEGYAVGGCVRDFIMGNEPHDYDIATNALPHQTIELFKDYNVFETGLKHGTVTVVSDGENVEITTYRVDGKYDDNRHPAEVSFSKSLSEDLARRDFTVNAMAYDGKEIIDCFGGREHIKEKLIACVGDADCRFAEDGLRIMRALRFASVLDFTVEKKTSESIHKNKNLLENISSERIFSELKKLLCGDGASRVLREYHDVIEVIIPEIAVCVGFDQHNYHHCYDVYEHTLRVVDGVPKEPVMRLAALFHDIAKPVCHTTDNNGVGHFYGHPKISADIASVVLARLKCDNETRRRVEKTVLYHDTDIVNTDTAVKRFLAKTGEEIFDGVMLLKRADRAATAPKYRDNFSDIDAVEQIRERLREENACFSLKTLAINGNDLIDVGITDGREIGLKLKRLLELVISGQLPNDKNSLINEIKRGNGG